MTLLLRALVFLSILGLAACDELAVADDPVALADVRGQKSCVAAVRKETGIAGVAINTSLPIVEVNRFIVDVPGGGMWTCVTNDAGRALEIVERRTG